MYYCNVISMTVNPYYCSLLYYLGDVEGTSQMRVSASERQFYKMISVRIYIFITVYGLPNCTALNPNISH